MSGGSRRRPSVPILLAVALMATLFAAPVGAAGTTPTLRLFVSSTQITVERNRHGFVSVDPGAWVTPVTDDFELWVSRPDYDTPITIKQVDADTKAVLRTFSAKNLEGWTGLKGFGHYVVEDANGEIVLRETVPDPVVQGSLRPSPRDRSGASIWDGRHPSSGATTTGSHGRPTGATTRSGSRSIVRGWICCRSHPGTPWPRST
jgi:hypothetical protein